MNAPNLSVVNSSNQLSVRDRKDEREPYSSKYAIHFNPAQNLDPIKPRNASQENHMKLLLDESIDCVVAIGNFGSGRTFLSSCMGYSNLLTGNCDKLTLCRPALESKGERLGFMPGDISEKMEHYFGPIKDSVGQLKVSNFLEDPRFEILALAFARGRTILKADFVLDEAQNSLKSQMKLALGRVGDGTRTFINGDLDQCDLPNIHDSGLADLLKLLEKAGGDVSSVGSCIVPINVKERGTVKFGFVKYDPLHVERSLFAAAVAQLYQE